MSNDKLSTLVASAREHLPEKAGNGNAAWLQKLREQGQNFLLEHDIPAIKDEEWKYTNLRKILRNGYSVADLLPAPAGGGNIPPHGLPIEEPLVFYFQNGKFLESHLPLEPPEGLSADSLFRAKAANPQHFEVPDAYEALNAGFSEDGLYLKVARNTKIDRPILIYHHHETFQRILSLPRVYVELEDGAEAEIFEYHTGKNEGDGSLSILVQEGHLGKNARLNWLKLQSLNPANHLIDKTYLTQNRDSYANVGTFTFSGGTIRNNLSFEHHDENIESHLLGLFLTHDKMHVDNHTAVDHRHPHCHSNELYKGVLGGRSTGVFNGKVFVQPEAQKTNAFQSNRNLVMNDNATINTKPQLEIWADDVSCSHGATTGSLDRELLFYLRSRGIAEQKARGLLIQAFANEVMEQVSNEAIKPWLEEQIQVCLESVAC